MRDAEKQGHRDILGQFVTTGYTQLWAKTDEVPDRSFLAASFFVSFLSFFSCTGITQKLFFRLEREPARTSLACKQAANSTHRLLRLHCCIFL